MRTLLRPWDGIAQRPSTKSRWIDPALRARSLSVAGCLRITATVLGGSSNDRPFFSLGGHRATASKPESPAAR